MRRWSPLRKLLDEKLSKSITSGLFVNLVRCSSTELGEVKAFGNISNPLKNAISCRSFGGCVSRFSFLRASRNHVR